MLAGRVGEKVSLLMRESCLIATAVQIRTDIHLYVYSYVLFILLP